ncbi:MAG: hypothetical protein HWE08_13430, partial [Alphaproteobacteria bacterium]|nr:hypothetical protein [Alphaproteobacteria bacterium]
MTYQNLIGNDYVFDGSGSDSTFRGGFGDDFLVGGSGDDYLVGRDGDDFIVGGGFYDGVGDIDWFGDGSFDQPASLDGVWAEGRDTLVGGAGDDTLIGGAWDDSLVNDNGWYDYGEEVSADVYAATYPYDYPENVIWAGSGNDVAVGGNAADVIGGGTGDDDL